jgi:hypothetical protein
MAYGEVGKLVKNVGTSIFNRTLGRLAGAGISTDSRLVQARAMWSGRSDTEDWRVRLQIPQQATDLQQAIFGNGTTDFNELLAPLRQDDFMGMFWPLTPAFIIQHSASYNALAQTHSNYPFQAYHMFHKVPVVVNTFNVELSPGIDYISTKQNNTPYRELTPQEVGFDLSAEQGASQTWAPTKSNISVLITPVYSRDSIKNFSLSEFARGKLNGKGTGEIGFI